MKYSGRVCIVSIAGTFAGVVAAHAGSVLAPVEDEVGLTSGLPEAKRLRRAKEATPWRSLPPDCGS